MKNATEKFLSDIDNSANTMKNRILNSEDTLKIRGNAYYVSLNGDDSNDGTSPQNAWKTLEKVSSAKLCEGDGVFFRRGDLFRGYIKAQSGVSYGAFGKGEKPRLFGWDEDLASPELWEIFDSEHNIWKYKKKILDSGTLVFNSGEAHSVKLIPSFVNGRFVCRDNHSLLFVMQNEMIRDLDIYWHYDEVLTTYSPFGEEAAPVPEINEKSRGTLYLRCDKGNPGENFYSIEALPRRSMFSVGECRDVRIDNLCLKYIGLHAVAAGGKSVNGLKVTNCEIGWIGGTVQHYFASDPNFKNDVRGNVTRFGNGVEIYGGCRNYEVSNCYIYQVYDAAITHQITTNGNKYVMENVLYKSNLIENCVYGIEYFLDMNRGDTESYMKNIKICDNFLRFSGYGWGQQRHNKNTPALIKGWSFVNAAENFHISDNIFDRSAYRMLHLVAKNEEYCPQLSGNTYIQNFGGMLGQYGANEEAGPDILLFEADAKEKITSVLGDASAKIYSIISAVSKR